MNKDIMLPWIANLLHNHQQKYDSSGGHRGILGGWRVSCVCGWYGVDWGDHLVFNEHQAEIIIAELEKDNEDTADA